MSDEQGTADPTWRVFQGVGVPRPNVELPKPPPWRRGAEDALANHASYTYRPYPRLVNAINLSISLRRPLLLTGQAGTGKSSVADAISRELCLGPVLRWNVTSKSRLQEGLYRYDALGRLQHQQLNKVDQLEKFISLGPLGTALAADRVRVLLIDEVDKGDIDLPGDLLNVLERGEFDIPELVRDEKRDATVRVDDDAAPCKIVDGRVKASKFPIIVMTSNGERDFPPAFLRRCIRETMEIPGSARLAEIVEAHLGSELARRANELITEFADKTGSDESPATLAVDQLLNTVLLMTRQDAPDGAERAQIIRLLQKELRD